MKLVTSSLAITFILTVSRASPVVRAQTPNVDLGYTSYQGTRLSSGVNQYLGISYAAPPLGKLRWRAPADPLRNSTLQDATKHSPICLGQVGFESYAAGAETSEDCLYLDVYAPSGMHSESGNLVWVYLPGGGYAANTNPRYNGSEIVSQSDGGIVFVYVNYRVGVYGFLAGEQVSQDGVLNAGLLDQRKALEWVQKYIHLFGGDPSQVTLHGGSAGAGSIAHHLSAYGGINDHLFHAAIVQSTFWPVQQTVAQAQAKFDVFAKNVSCAETEDVMVCLRSKDTATLQASNRASPLPGTEVSLTPFWQYLPVVDGNLVQSSLHEAFQTGKFFTVPTIIGNDKDEGTYFAPNASTSAEFLNFIKANYPYLTDSSLRKINNTYGLGEFPIYPMHKAYFTSAAVTYGEATFNCPGNLMVEALSMKAPKATWDYHTAIEDKLYETIGLGTPHLFETTAIFGPGQDQPCDGCSFATYNAAIVPIVMDYMISFVKTLSPNQLKNSAAPVWQTWNSSSDVSWLDWKQDLGRRIVFKTNATAMAVVPADEVSRCNLWDSLSSEMQQ